MLRSEYKDVEVPRGASNYMWKTGNEKYCYSTIFYPVGFVQAVSLLHITFQLMEMFLSTRHEYFKSIILVFVVCERVLSWHSCVWLFATPWTVACQVPLVCGILHAEYWSGLPFPPPEDHSDSGIESASPALTGRFFITASYLGA